VDKKESNWMNLEMSKNLLRWSRTGEVRPNTIHTPPTATHQSDTGSTLGLIGSYYYIYIQIKENDNTKGS
jgi:hypothetical protein